MFFENFLQQLFNFIFLFKNQSNVNKMISQKQFIKISHVNSKMWHWIHGQRQIKRSLYWKAKRFSWIFVPKSILRIEMYILILFILRQYQFNFLCCKNLIQIMPQFAIKLQIPHFKSTFWPFMPHAPLPAIKKVFSKYLALPIFFKTTPYPLCKKFEDFYKWSQRKTLEKHKSDQTDRQINERWVVHYHLYFMDIKKFQ